MSKPMACGFVCTVLLITLFIGTAALAENPVQADGTQDNLRPEDKLVILWTSGDPEVALNMIFMYAGNSPRFGWWKDITLIVWGPSAKLLAQNEELQAAVKSMAESGIIMEACKACSDSYGVSDDLVECGISVKYMGNALTSYIKEGRHILTI